MLKPIDILAKTFKTGRGYKKEEVDEFFIQVGKDYEALYKENIELKDKMNSLNEGLQYYKSMEGTMQKALVLAEKASSETTDNAAKKAEEIEATAKAKADEIITNAKAELGRILTHKAKVTKEYEAVVKKYKELAFSQLELIEGPEFRKNVEKDVEEGNFKNPEKERREAEREKKDISLFFDDVKKENAENFAAAVDKTIDDIFMAELEKKESEKKSEEAAVKSLDEILAAEQKKQNSEKAPEKKLSAEEEAFFKLPAANQSIEERIDKLKEEAEAEIKAEIEKEVKIEPKPGVRAEVKEESKPEVRAEVKEESKLEVKEEAKEEPKPEVRVEAKENANAEEKLVAAEEPKEENKPEVKAEAKEEPKPEVKAEAKGEPKGEPKPEVKAEVKEEPKPEVRAEAKENANAGEKLAAAEEPKEEDKPETLEDIFARIKANKEESAKKKEMHVPWNPIATPSTESERAERDASGTQVDLSMVNQKNYRVLDAYQKGSMKVIYAVKENAEESSAKEGETVLTEEEKKKLEDTIKFEIIE